MTISKTKELDRQARWRSFTKGLTWRLLATSTTILLSFLVTGEINTALKIGPIDFVTKLFVYYVYERLWLLDTMQSINHRTMWKTAGWKVIALSMTITTTYYVTGSIDSAIRVGPADFTAKLLLYYLHDVLWDAIPAGRNIETIESRNIETIEKAEKED